MIAGTIKAGPAYSKHLHMKVASTSLSGTGAQDILSNSEPSERNQSTYQNTS